MRCGASLIADQPDPQTTMNYSPGESPETLAPLSGQLPERATLVIRSGGGRAGETYSLTGRADHDRPPPRLRRVPRRRHRLAQPRRGHPRERRLRDRRPGSLNGTYVNRRRIERQTLLDSDELQVGKYKLTFITP